MELLLVIAIIAILAAILLPVIAAAREKGRQAACVSQMKQMGTAMRLYLDDHDGTYPTYADRQADGSWVVWHHKVEPYGLKAALLVCPSSRKTAERETVFGSGSYGYNYWHLGAWPGHIALDGLLTDPSSTIAIGEITRRVHGAVIYPPPTDVGSVPTDSTGPIWPAVQTAEEREFKWLNSGDRHLGGMNCLFCDGHVKRKTLKELGDRPELFYGTR